MYPACRVCGTAGPFDLEQKLRYYIPMEYFRHAGTDVSRRTTFVVTIIDIPNLVRSQDVNMMYSNVTH